MNETKTDSTAAAFGKVIGDEVFWPNWTRPYDRVSVGTLGSAFSKRDPKVYLRMYQVISEGVASMVATLQEDWKNTKKAQLSSALAQDTVLLALLVGCANAAVDGFTALMECLRTRLQTTSGIRDLREQWRNWMTDFWPKSEIQQLSSQPFVPLNEQPIQVKTIADVYKFQKELGKGLFGTVYSAVSALMPDKRVVIKETQTKRKKLAAWSKVIDVEGAYQEQKDLFIREVKLLNDLQSEYYQETKITCPHFMACYLGFYEDADAFYFVMQYAPGITLHQYLQTVYQPAMENGTLAEKTEQKKTFREILRQILEGLEWLADHQYVFLDLSAHNVMVDFTGASPHVTFVDYGSWCSVKEKNPLPCGFNAPAMSFFSPEVTSAKKQPKGLPSVSFDIAKQWNSSPIYSLGKMLQFYRVDKFDPCVQKLIQGMIIDNPKARYTFQELLQYLKQCQ